MDIWSFAKSFYAVEQNKCMCLRLQDDYDINVVVLIWLLWLVFEGNANSDQSYCDIEECRTQINRITHFSQHSVKDIRASRMHLTHVIAASEHDAEVKALSALRQLTIELEIEHEKWMLLSLAQNSERLRRAPAAVKVLPANELLEAYLVEKRVDNVTKVLELLLSRSSNA